MEQEEVQEAQGTASESWELVDIQAVPELTPAQVDTALKFMAPLTMVLASGPLPASQDTVTTLSAPDSVMDMANTTLEDTIRSAVDMEDMAPLTVLAALVSEPAVGEPAASDLVTSDPALPNAPRL